MLLILCIWFTEQVVDIPESAHGFRKYLLVFLLGIWSPLSSPHPATLLNPSLQVPVRCGDRETLRELGWAPLPERIHLLLVLSDWLL